jgi:hypothetical protein
MFIYFQNKTNKLEKMTNATDIRSTVKEVYKADVQAIKNLGDFASTFLSADKKKLTLPFDEVEISGALNVKGQDIKLNDTIRLVSDAENSYLQTKKDNGFVISKWMTGETVPLRSGHLSANGNITTNNDVLTTNLYTENIGKHKGDGWLRINNIGNSASVALFGTMSINEHKGKGGLNVGSLNETGIGNGNLKLHGRNFAMGPLGQEFK